MGQKIWTSGLVRDTNQAQGHVALEKPFDFLRAKIMVTNFKQHGF